MIIHKLQLLFEILQVPLAALPLIQVLEPQQRLQQQLQHHQSLTLIVVIMILIKEDVINALPFTI